MKVFVIICFIVSHSGLWSQTTISIPDLEPDPDYDNIFVKKIYTNLHTSTFVIWIKKHVKSHKHITHTEQVMVLEGKARVKLNNNEFLVQKGDWIIIPEQTIHEVTVLSKKPLKIISVQTPEFTGKDRVFIE